jgi:hypothetical protein
MKTIITLVLASLCSYYSFGQVGTVFTSGQLNFRITAATTVEVAPNPNFTGGVSIPSTLLYNSVNFNVTAIGVDAFSNCTALTSVTMPSTVTTIGNFAFKGCAGLTSISIPNTVKFIGSSAFEKCTGLTSVILLNSVTSIGNYVFALCERLRSVTISSSLTSIGDYAFYSCTGLTSITVNWTTPLSINSSVFDKISLPNIKLNVPLGTQELYKTANIWKEFGSFREQVYLPLPNETFTVNGINYVVTKANLPYEVAVGSNPKFVGAANIPDTVTTDGSSFAVTSISSNAFYLSTGLTAITIPPSVTSIEDSAFSNCYFLNSVIISDSVIRIGGSAFYRCESLTSINIPSSVNSIGSLVFTRSGIIKVTVNWVNPLSIVQDVFYDIAPMYMTLQVPAGTENLYKMARVWKEFNIQTTLGLNSISTNNGQLFYPNPAQSQINFYQEMLSLEIFDNLGRKVKLFQNPTRSFDVSTLPKGVYILQGKTTERKASVQKMVKL